MPDCLKTKINILDCVFGHDGQVDLAANSVEGKQVVLKTSSNVELYDGFSAKDGSQQWQYRGGVRPFGTELAAAFIPRINERRPI